MFCVFPFKIIQRVVVHRFYLLARPQNTEVQLLWLAKANAMVSWERVPSLGFAVQWSSLEALPTGSGARCPLPNIPLGTWVSTNPDG